MIYEKKTKSGPLLEANFYPAFADGRRISTRPKEKKRSTAEQQRYNHAQAVRKTVLYINANFDKGDILMHPTYDPDFLPSSEEKVHRDATNYMRRVKNARESKRKRIEQELAELPDTKTFADMRARLKKQ